MATMIVPKYADTKFSRQMCRAYTDKKLCGNCDKRFVCYTER